MKGWIILLCAAAAAACGAGDDTAGGSRGNCAFGGALTDCPDTERTAEAACWRLVDCGVIPLASDDNGTNAFDWGQCVDYLQRSVEDSERLIVACIAGASCDSLRPVDNEIRCFRLGGR